MTLRDYVLIVGRSWIVIVVTVVIGLATAGILAFAATPTYTSSAQVLFTGHATTSGQDLAYVGNYVQSRMQTYERLGTSNSILEPVSRAMGNDTSAKELADRVEIEAGQLDTVATISVTDPTAKGAARTADTLARVLLEAVQKLEGGNAVDPSLGDDDKPAKATVRGVVSGKAQVPTLPSGPNLPLYLLTGALVGLAVSIGVIGVREVQRGEASSSSGEDP